MEGGNDAVAAADGGAEIQSETEGGDADPADGQPQDAQE